MRARLIVMSLLAVAALAAAPAAFASGRNAQTAGLQVALRAQGLYRGSIDAIAGPGTVAAVRTFQRSHGLRVTGLADARTRRALGPLGRPLFGARQLRRGAFGWDVAVLQFLLVRQGIAVPINAYFDGPTAHGVKLLQRRLHLRRDGVVGPHTLTAIVRRNPVPLAQGAVTVATHVTHRTKHRSTSVSSVRALLDRWALHYGVSFHLVRALAWMESGYNNALVSSVGARGIMQLLPTTFRFAETVLIGHRLVHNADGNVRAGVAYLAHLLRDFRGNKRLALAGWYQGERAVRKHGLYKVTRPFVANVLALAARM